jgi:hypothetical protein
MGSVASPPRMVAIARDAVERGLVELMARQWTVEPMSAKAQHILDVMARYGYCVVKE